MNTPVYGWIPAFQAGYAMNENGEGINHQYNFGAHQEFQGFRLYTRYQRSESAQENSERITANLSTPTWSWSRPFTHGVLTATPNISLNFQDETIHSHLGMNAAYSSKPLFNGRFRWRANYGRAYGFTSDEAERQTERQFLSAEAEYAFSSNLRLKASYRTSFEDGGEFFLVLQGALDFNPTRTHKATLAGRGILDGLVYLDRNRDEIKQQEEPGLPGVGIRLKGTRLGLRSNRHGKFTILNLPARTYDVTLLQETLPFGLLPSRDPLPKLLVEEGKSTQVEIPIIASGQLRGRVFIDGNNNGGIGREDLCRILRPIRVRKTDAGPLHTAPQPRLSAHNRRTAAAAGGGADEPRPDEKNRYPGNSEITSTKNAIFHFELDLSGSSGEIKAIHGIVHDRLDALLFESRGGKLSTGPVKLQDLYRSAEEPLDRRRQDTEIIAALPRATTG
jgi:hypothetical protein